MAHCPFDLLEDIETVLGSIRKLPKIKEVKPGIFYLKNRGFLHFHINKENVRWADVHNGVSWGQPVELPFKPSKKIVSDFLKTVEIRYKKIIQPK